jgi:hypothetical protein
MMLRSRVAEGQFAPASATTKQSDRAHADQRRPLQHIRETRLSLSRKFLTKDST